MNHTQPTSINRALVAAMAAFIFSTALISASHAQLFGFGKRNSDPKSTQAMIDARAALAEKIAIEAKDGRFVLEFPKHDEVEELSKSIVKNAYSSSRSSGGGKFFCQSESDVAQFMINSGTDRWGQKKENQKIIRLTDLTDATNRVEIELDDAEQRLSMISVNLAQEHIHIVRQTHHRLTLVAIEGDSFSHMSDETINELVAQSEFATTLDRFRAAGLGVPKVAARSNIEELIESILNFSDEDRKTFEATFPNLASKKFKLRKQESQNLSKHLDQHIVAVAAMLASNNLPLETRARFIEALQASDDESTVLMINTVVDGKLLKSPEILAKLLSHQVATKTSKQSIRNTIQQLETVTDQNFGDDVDAWSNWVSQWQTEATKSQPTKTVKEEPNANANANLTNPPAPKTRRRLRKTGREQVEQPLKDLLKLKLDDRGNLAIDRNHWSKTFDGKTPTQLMKEVRQSFEASGLPKSWLKMGGEHNVAGLGYEQILFQRIADNVKVRSEVSDHAAELNNNKTKSLNRTMYKSDLRMTLMVHPEQSRWRDVRGKRTFFKFLFEDEAEDLFYLLSEHPKIGFSIFVFWKDGETILNLRSDKDGQVQLHHVFQQKQTSLSSTSVKRLQKQHGDFLRMQILPLLNKIGVSAESIFRQSGN
jgi:hypothetical protein